MDIIPKDERRRITGRENLTFSLDNTGLYLIKVTARVQGKESLQVEIDGRKFPPNSPAVFTGGQLKGLKQTIFFILPLSNGKHTVSLIPYQGADLEDIKASPLSDELSIVNNLSVVIDVNERAEDGDRRSWVTFVLADLSLVSITPIITYSHRKRDSDDVKIIIDGQIQGNLFRTVKHLLWRFAGSLLPKGSSKTETETFTPNLSQGLHYIEFYADRMPVLVSVAISVGRSIDKDRTIRKYKDNKFKRDYNQLDDYIIKATDFWNNFFLNQMYPLPKVLDPALVKAIVYRESRLGYYPGENIVDVMQVWDPKNPAQSTLLGDTPEYEFVSPEKIEFIHKFYPQGKIPKVDNREESIFWGVRWLFHKAQYIIGKSSPYKREWLSWRDAVRKYNANQAIVEEYLQEVFSVYEKGVDLKGNVLWQK